MVTNEWTGLRRRGKRLARIGLRGPGQQRPAHLQSEERIAAAGPVDAHQQRSGKGRVEPRLEQPSPTRPPSKRAYIDAHLSIQRRCHRRSRLAAVLPRADRIGGELGPLGQHQPDRLGGQPANGEGERIVTRPICPL